MEGPGEVGWRSGAVALETASRDDGERDEPRAPADMEAASARSGARIARAVRDLVADHERSGELARSGIERLVLKRQFAPDEIVAVFRGLATAGISFDDQAEHEEAAAPTAVGSPEWVPGLFGHALLTRRQEVELGRAVRIGSMAEREMAAGIAEPGLDALATEGARAASRLVSSNMRLVLSIAARRARRGAFDVRDLVQDGTLGLMRAAANFDPDVGCRFSTYATWWIRQSIHRAIDDVGDEIRIPVHRRDDIRRMRRTTRLLLLETGREPTLSDVAARLEWDLDKAAYIDRLSRFRTTPIEVHGEDEEERGPSLAAVLPCPAPNPEEMHIAGALRQLVDWIVNGLADRERDVILRRFGFLVGGEQTLQQIGDLHGVTRERIRQIEARALRRLSTRARVAGASHFL